MTVLPAKPIERIHVCGLFRHRTGTVWFDDLQLWTVPLFPQAALFDGVPVAPAVVAAVSPGPSIRTDDGLVLAFDARTGHVVTTAPGGLFFRDVANRSHFVQPSGTLGEQADGAMVFEGQD